MTKFSPNTTAVITGATSGIGFALAKQLVKSSVFVIGIGRSDQRNSMAKEKILADVPNGNLEYLNADLAQLENVETVARAIQDHLIAKGYFHLDILVNNAGAYLEHKEKTSDGIEKTFAVNHLAQFGLTFFLRSLLAKSHHGKMISVSSYAHFNTPMNLGRITDPWPYFGLLAYKRSKLCNVLFVQSISKRRTHFNSYAADPGLVNTRIASKSGAGISDFVWSFRKRSGMPPEISAMNLLSIITTEAFDNLDGVYIKERKVILPSKKAQDIELAERLWDLSCELTGLDWD